MGLDVARFLATWWSGILCVQIANFSAWCSVLGVRPLAGLDVCPLCWQDIQKGHVMYENGVAHRKHFVN